MIELTEKISLIHNSKLFGNVIELGCGCCISNALLSVEGASKTINECYVPYSKESQKKYNFEGRSVSKEMVLKILESNFLIKSDINYCLAASFQLQGEGQNQLTHGFIGIASNIFVGLKPNFKIYHISIPQKLKREDYFKIISEVGIEILFSLIRAKLYSNGLADHILKTTDGSVSWVPSGEAINNIESNYIDAVYKIDSLELKEDIDSTINILKNSTDDEDNFIVFSPEHKLIRFENFVRDKPGIILMKGSFNPIHERHIMMMNDAQKSYPDYVAAFSCSIKRFDKPDLQVDELLEKIEKINSLGYYFVLNNNKFYVGTVSWIRQRWKQPVILPIGMDTINKWIKSEVDDELELVSSFQKIKIPSGLNFKHKEKTRDEILVNNSLKIFKLLDNTKFLVFNRSNTELSDDYKYFKEWIELYGDGSKKDDGISSTKIRAGEYKSQIS